MAQAVLITLDRERALKWTMNALADASEVAPDGTDRVLAGAMNMSGLRAILWGMLKVEDSRLTLERTGELLDGYLESGGNLGDVLLAVNKAIMASGFYRPPEGIEGNGKPEAGSPSTSGAGSQTPGE